jgi:hypothetical protein
MGLMAPSSTHLPNRRFNYRELRRDVVHLEARAVNVRVGTKRLGGGLVGSAKSGGAGQAQRVRTPPAVAVVVEKPTIDIASPLVLTDDELKAAAESHRKRRWLGRLR